MIDSVQTLSDDDEVAGQSQAVAAVPQGDPLAVVSSRKRKRQEAVVSAASSSEERQKLRHVVDKNCFCRMRRLQRRGSARARGSCFQPFRERGLFDALHKLRMDLKTMTKEDSDRKASHLI